MKNFIFKKNYLKIICFVVAKDCPSKGFALRPSALSAAAESIIMTPKTGKQFFFQ